MYKTVASLGAIAALAATATAHGTTNGVTIDGQYIGGFKLDYYYAKQNKQPVADHIGWYAEDLDNGFVTPSQYNSGDIICHKNASPDGSSDTMAKVAAGGKIDFHWTPWPTSHVGPVITYVAPYTGDIASVSKNDLKWTKIDAHGYEDGQWAAIKMIAQNNTWPVTVPSTLKAGKYVFRHEIIALHAAQSVGGAQNYPQCLNIEVTGSGTESPEGVAGTALYKQDEDGIVFNPYVPSIKYNIPGPALFGGASNSSPDSSPSAAVTTTTATTATTTTAVAGKTDTPTTTGTPAKKSAAAPAPAASEKATKTGYAAAPAGPTTTASSGNGGDLPKEFTVEQFIKWLEAKTGASGKARRHARALF